MTLCLVSSVQMYNRGRLLMNPVSSDGGRGAAPPRTTLRDNNDIFHRRKTANLTRVMLFV
jgi:hypothetical protein